MRVCMLTTSDNPYDPFDDFDEWFLFDVEKGYNTCGYLARIAKTNEGMSRKEYNEEIERAINEILSYDFTGLREKVAKEV